MSRYYGDYHTHTRYSDATGTIEDNVIAAREKGLKDIGISDHGYNNITLSLTRKKSQRQKLEIEKIRKKYNDINIFYSIEADLIATDGTLDMELEEMADFDYIIAGFHRWARAKSFRDFRQLYIPAYKTSYRKPKPQEIARNTDATIKMLERYPIAILPHISNATTVDCKAVAQACAELNVLIELNVKHIRENLANGNLEKILETKAELIASSDAHTPLRVGNLDVVDEFIAPYGLDSGRIVNLRQETPKFRNYRNWKG